MPGIQYRWIEADELEKIAGIDRSERIRSGYVYQKGQLKKLAVNWDTPTFLVQGTGEHSVSAQIRFCRDHLGEKGCALGAFDGRRLVGIGVLRPGVRPGTAQLAYLHVSRAYRRKGIARRLFQALIQEAEKTGAHQIYVSATPSGSAVGFYLSQGFEPVDDPIPELFELEPEDIHMLKSL